MSIVLMRFCSEVELMPAHHDMRKRMQPTYVSSIAHLSCVWAGYAAMGMAAVAGKCGTIGPAPRLDSALPHGHRPNRAVAHWCHALKMAPARYVQPCTW